MKLNIKYWMVTNMDWNTIFNGILAIIAIVGFIISLYFSRKSLKQVKELNDKAINAQLFEKRYEIIEFFENLLTSPDDLIELKFDKNLLFKYFYMIDSLFNKGEEIKKPLRHLLQYHNSKDIKHLKKPLVKELDIESDIRFSFFSYYKVSLIGLKEELGIVELKKGMG